MLKIWGRRSVANVQKVLWCAGELGLPYAHAETRPPFEAPRERAYLDSKAANTVPVIDDDGVVLWEGNAIARYLAEKHGRGTLWPTDPVRRADADRWMDYQLSTVRVHIHPLMREDLGAAEIAFHSRALAEVMKPVEATLAGQPFLAGDSFSMGDIPVGIVTFRWFVLNIERPAMPATEAWYDRLRARPAFIANVIPPEDPNIGFRKAAG
jgi:glutathione S-transferase